MACFSLFMKRMPVFAVVIGMGSHNDSASLCNTLHGGMTDVMNLDLIPGNVDQLICGKVGKDVGGELENLQMEFLYTILTFR